MRAESRPVYRYLAGLAVFDEDFRNYLLQDPVAAARSAGVMLSDGQQEHLSSLNTDEVQTWLDGFEEMTGQPIHAMSGW